MKNITKVKNIFGKLNKVVNTPNALKEIDEMFEEWNQKFSKCGIC